MGAGEGEMVGQVAAHLLILRHDARLPITHEDIYHRLGSRVSAAVVRYLAPVLMRFGICVHEWFKDIKG